MNGADAPEINLLEYWEAIWKRRRLIIWTCAASLAVTLIYCLLAPKTYESKATILTPKEGVGGGFAMTLATSGMMSQAPGFPMPSLTQNLNLFLSILKSQTMARDVVEKFDLQKRYGARYLSEAIKALQETTAVSPTKEGVIEIKVEETDPRLAADIANFFAANLDRMLTGFGTTEAGKKRAFIADQLTKTERELHRAEEALKRFQETHKAIALEAQALKSVDAAASLKGQILASEVQLEVLRKFAAEENTEVIRLKRQIEEMRRKLSQMQSGEGWKPASARLQSEETQEYQVPFSEFPELSLEYARLARDVKVQETVYILLTQQLEEAKIAEARDTPTVRILDQAVAAEKKSKPRTTLNLLVVGFTSLLLGVFFSLSLDYLDGLKRARPSRAPTPSS